MVSHCIKELAPCRPEQLSTQAVVIMLQRPSLLARVFLYMVLIG